MKLLTTLFIYWTTHLITTGTGVSEMRISNSFSEQAKTALASGQFIKSYQFINNESTEPKLVQANWSLEINDDVTEIYYTVNGQLSIIPVRNPEFTNISFKCNTTIQSNSNSHIIIYGNNPPKLIDQLPKAIITIDLSDTHSLTYELH